MEAIATAAPSMMPEVTRAAARAGRACLLATTTCMRTSKLAL